MKIFRKGLIIPRMATGTGLFTICRELQYEMSLVCQSGGMKVERRDRVR